MRPIKVGNSYYINIPNKIMDTFEFHLKNFMLKVENSILTYKPMKDDIEQYVRSISNLLDIYPEQARTSIKRFRDRLISDDHEDSLKACNELCEWLNAHETHWDAKYVSFKDHLCGEIIDNDFYYKLVNHAADLLDVK
jgi:hypothetical protein